MIQPVIRIATLWAILAHLAPIAGAEGGPEYRSPLDIAAADGGRVLYIAEHTANRVSVFDAEREAVVNVIPLPLPPTGIALSPDESLLYVTGGAPEGRLFIVDPARSDIVGTIPLGHTPRSPVVSPDGKRLYACNQFDNTVSVADLETGAETARIPVSREPVSCAITPDGSTLYVANHLHNTAADRDYVAAVVSVIDTETSACVKRIGLPNGSMGLKDVCVSPDGKHAYVTHVLARFHLPTTQLERGWMNTNALTIIDAPERTRINTVLLDSVDLGAANPWGVSVSPDGEWIYVAQAGSQDISVINRPALHEKIQRVENGEAVNEVSDSPDDIPNDLSFLSGIRERVNVAGNGPRGIAAVGSKAYFTEYFTGSLGLLDNSNPERPKIHSVPLGPNQPMTKERKGEMFFHDASLCFQKWQSCATCHPGDARADGLNWDLLNDGIGNPKNAKSLLYSYETPPSMVSGVRGHATMAVRAGIRYIQFAVRPKADAEAIDAYMLSLKPVPSPALEDGTPSEAALRGKEVFKKADCASCHGGPYFTDLKSYDVGTGEGREEGMAFDTPALTEIWRTAPYLHDGRSATLMEMLTIDNPNDRHGKTSNLSQGELSDLAEYLSSL